MSSSFADLGVSRAVVRALSERGFSEPFAIQKLVIGDVLAGRDVLAKSPTGSGKTLAFAVPLSDRVIKARENGWQERDEQGWKVDRTLGFAHLGGATLDNEENYLIKKAWTLMGAVQIENQARI